MRHKHNPVISPLSVCLTLGFNMATCLGSLGEAGVPPPIGGKVRHEMGGN